MLKKLRIIFAGTPDFAAQHLLYLLQYKEKYKIVGILTQPDKPSGRGKKIIFNPVKILALKYFIPILQPSTLNALEVYWWIKKHSVDIMIVIAYGLIVPKMILNMIPLGCINIHCSLLPRWRGASPVQRAILAGDQNTGITIIQMNEYLDAGDILYQLNCEISLNDTSASVYQKLLRLGLIAIYHTLELLILGKLKPKKQEDNNLIYATKIKKYEAYINWDSSAINIERSIRAFIPWPVSFFIINDKIIKIWNANVTYKNTNAMPGTILYTNKQGIGIATAEGVLNIIELQMEGKRIMTINDFLNARRNMFIVGKQIVNIPV
uniref:Methionyl-tRNA formyltransferase n=1 Tax=Candidatus Aschnera chinzeii TaxID=1485666 RepID=A0AAT9G4Y1_9ENTR|nr:MAG: methionyl-tRNA formyltransferase [Candidatus Aschnera chinzeii]